MIKNEIRREERIKKILSINRQMRELIKDSIAITHIVFAGVVLWSTVDFIYTTTMKGVGYSCQQLEEKRTEQEKHFFAAPVMNKLSQPARHFAYRLFE